MLQYCKNKLEVVVDKAPWYHWALQRLGFKYRNETFGERNAVEGFFSKLKERTKRFQNRFPFNSSINSILKWLKSFVALYNFRKINANIIYNKTS